MQISFGAPASGQWVACIAELIWVIFIVAAAASKAPEALTILVRLRYVNIFRRLAPHIVRVCSFSQYKIIVNFLNIFECLPALIVTNLAVWTERHDILAIVLFTAWRRRIVGKEQ